MVTDGRQVGPDDHRSDTKNNDGSTTADPFAQGAGEVTPAAMLSRGLVYDAGADDWLSYLEGLGYDTGTGTPAVSPSTYNQASIAAGSLVSSITVTRRVTAVTPGIYQAKVPVPGFTVTVSPSILVMNYSGQVKQFKVTLTRTTAPLKNYSTGFLTWRGANTSVRSLIAVRPLAVRAPGVVNLTAGPTSTTSWKVTSGSSGAFGSPPTG